jgi:hypothetical protein
MKVKYLIIITLMTGLISIAGNCLSGQWSAARRPRSSTGGSAGTTSTSISKTGSEFATPTRSFRCRPVSGIHRPRGRRAAKEPAPTTTKTAEVTPVKPAPVKPAESKELPPPPPPEPPAAAVSKPAPDTPAISDAGDTPAAPAPPTQKSASSYGKVPPYFIRNDGQLDQAVRYYVKGPRGTVYLTGTEVVFDFLQENPPEEGEVKEEEEEPGRPGPEREEKKTFTRLVFRQQFKDSTPEVKVDGEKELPGKINYFIGGKDNWHSNIPTVEEVIYHDLYPGVNLNCFFEGANIRYRYTVKPGADPGRLVFQYVGIDGLEIKPSGDLIVLTPFGGFITPAPRITQEIDGEEKEIEGEFTLQDDTTVTYQIGAYDKQYPLTIK